VQVVDGAVISAPQKSLLRDGIAKIQKRVVDANKAAGAENKRKAVETALEAADAAVSAKRGFLVAKLDVGLDTKAVQEAYKAVQDAHPTLPSLYITADISGDCAYDAGHLRVKCLSVLIWLSISTESSIGCQ
jgi:alanyl-tRNA synthetase